MGMKVTILEAGRAPGRLSEDYPRYPDMFVALLSKADESLRFDAVALVDGERRRIPPSAMPCSSPARPRAFMIRRRGWIRCGDSFAKRSQRARRWSACASATRSSPMRWAGRCASPRRVGRRRHTYEIVDRRDWMTDAGASVSLSVSHQDQVITPPASAITLARSAHTDHAMLAYTNAPVISLQGHPEFSDRFVSALWSARRGKTLTDDQVDRALESLVQTEDRALVAEWMVNFLKSRPLARLDQPRRRDPAGHLIHRRKDQQRLEPLPRVPQRPDRQQRHQRHDSRSAIEPAVAQQVAKPGPLSPHFTLASRETPRPPAAADRMSAAGRQTRMMPVSSRSVVRRRAAFGDRLPRRAAAYAPDDDREQDGERRNHLGEGQVGTSAQYREAYPRLGMAAQ